MAAIPIIEKNISMRQAMILQTSKNTTITLTVPLRMKMRRVSIMMEYRPVALMPNMERKVRESLPILTTSFLFGVQARLVRDSL